MHRPLVFFLLKGGPSPIGANQAQPPKDQDPAAHRGLPWEHLRLHLWLSLHYVPAGCSSSNIEVLLFVEGKETLNYPYQKCRPFIQRISDHSSLSLGLLFFSCLWLSDWDHFFPQGLLLNTWLSPFPLSPLYITDKGPMCSKQVQPWLA